jgi:uncharacterized protein YbjT (DUF2867 family)
MKVLLTGASGLIGSAVRVRLVREGHEVVAVVRPGGTSAADPAGGRTVAVDIAKATQPGDWLPHLDGVEAVVNCAGVLQDSPRDSIHGVHAAGVSALFAACERRGVRRVVHLSAIGVDRGALTPFSESKLAGDAILMARDLDWVILRPSVVVGRPAYGGSALFRGLAALPMLPVMPDTGPLQVVQLEDVVETVVVLLRPEAPARVVLEVAGPERLNMTEIVTAYRRWLGWGRPRTVRMPGWLAGAMYRLGDFAGWLGWRPPIRTTAEREMVRGAVGDPSEWQRLTGIVPRALGEALALQPPSVQERWFAQLYFLKPLVFVVLALFWIATGLVSLGPGYGIGLSLMAEGGAASIGPETVIAGAIADIVIGAAIAFRRTARAGLFGAIAITIGYVFLGTYLVPRLWADPLGPMLKIWPILVLHLVALAILDDR